MQSSTNNPNGFSLEQRLSPARFTQMSATMAALVGWLIGEQFTDPAISDITVTSDGHVMVQREGDIGFNHYLGTAEETGNNFRRLFEAVPDLEGEEVSQMKARLARKGIPV